MTERPILFSGPMVRAILEKRKTQTRRVAKDLNPAYLAQYADDPKINQFCKFGQPGDRLWVRESWLQWECPQCDLGMTPSAERRCTCTCRTSLRFRADCEIPAVRWRPSIHMPRWASRLTLEITDVRVQRLEKISPDDAIAEGITKVRESCYVMRGFGYDNSGLCHSCPTTPFQQLWDSINAKRGYGWDTNCWVWCVSFTSLPPDGAPKGSSK